MTHRRTGISWLTRLRGFAADQAGVSAVEFAILLPLMLTLYLGGVEISQAVSADRKTTLVAHTVGDLTAQASTVSTTDINNILSAAAAVAYPFPAANLKVKLSSVCIDATGTIATINWGETLHDTARTSGATVTSSIPKALMSANTSLIWGEASYAYKPTIGWTITGTLNLKDQFFLRPRLSCSVTLAGVPPCC